MYVIFIKNFGLIWVIVVIIWIIVSFRKDDLKLLNYFKQLNDKEMENIKVAIWGFGAMGSGMAAMLLEKQGVEIIGVCDKSPSRVGKSIYEVLGIPQNGRKEIIKGFRESI